MTKQEYIKAVKSNLKGLDSEDIESAIELLEEGINDRMDMGLSEEEAVADMQTPKEAARQIKLDTPFPQLVKAKAQSKPLKAWEIVLLILGAPLWLPLLIALGAIIFAVVITILAVAFAVFVTVIALVVAGTVAVFASLIALIAGLGIKAIVTLGASLVVIGIGLLLLLPGIIFSKWMLSLIGKFFRWIKGKIVR